MSEEQISMSPTARQMVGPTEHQLFSFADALKAVVNGAKMSKMEWEDPTVYLTLHGDRVMIMNGTFNDQKLHPFVMQKGDIEGDDWVVV
jgi:hypothetical protein